MLGFGGRAIGSAARASAAARGISFCRACAAAITEAGTTPEWAARAGSQLHRSLAGGAGWYFRLLWCGRVLPAKAPVGAVAISFALVARTAQHLQIGIGEGELRVRAAWMNVVDVDLADRA